MVIIWETYKVQVARMNPTHVRATVRNFQMELGGKRADLTAGFNPVETLLSAVGTFELAKKNSTVFQTVSLAVPIQGSWMKLPLQPGS